MRFSSGPSSLSATFVIRYGLRGFRGLCRRWVGADRDVAGGMAGGDPLVALIPQVLERSKLVPKVSRLGGPPDVGEAPGFSVWVCCGTSSSLGLGGVGTGSLRVASVHHAGQDSACRGGSPLIKHAARLPERISRLLFHPVAVSTVHPLSRSTTERRTQKMWGDRATEAGFL